MESNNNVSEKEIMEAMKELLRANGNMNRLQAEIRAKITEALRVRQEHGPCEIGPPPATEEITLVNELIREYLEWNGYIYTSSVMVSETAMSPEKKTRLQLCTEVGVKDDDRSLALPLLSNIVTAYTDRIKRKINKSKK